MATFDFAPSNQAPFQFQPTLDGQVYNCVVTWSLFGRRFYINLFRLDGTRVVTTPMVGSPNDADIDLVGGYFQTSKMIYREAARQIVVSP